MVEESHKESILSYVEDWANIWTRMLWWDEIPDFLTSVKKSKSNTRHQRGDDGIMLWGSFSSVKLWKAWCWGSPASRAKTDGSGNTKAYSNVRIGQSKSRSKILAKCIEFCHRIKTKLDTNSLTTDNSEKEQFTDDWGTYFLSVISDSDVLDFCSSVSLASCPHLSSIFHI